MNVKQPPRQRKGAYQRLMPISNSCPSWTSHFLTALTVKFTSRLNATKEYGGWRVNDSSVMMKARHSFFHFLSSSLSPRRRRFPQYGGFFCHDAVMESLPVNLLQVCVSVISTELFCEGREEERGKKERDKEKKEFILYCNTNTRHLKYSNNEAHVASISKCRRAAWEAKGKRDWLGPKNCQQNPYFIMTKEDQQGIFRKQHD